MFNVSTREIALQKGWLLLELETMPNHVHLLLARFPWLRGDLNSYQFWNRSFHYTRHDDASLETVRTYIRNQRKAGGLTE